MWLGIQAVEENSFRNSLSLLLVQGQHGQMKDKLRREFSLGQSPHTKGLLKETAYSPSLGMGKTNIYSELECGKNVLSCMFMENTWQLFAINTSCDAENENQQEKLSEMIGGQLP